MLETVTAILAAAVAIPLLHAALRVADGRGTSDRAWVASSPLVGPSPDSPPNVPDCGTRPAAPDDWQVVTVADLTAAEELLDLLEARGAGERELIVLGNAAFAVRWRESEPPGPRRSSAPIPPGRARRGPLAPHDARGRN